MNFICKNNKMEVEKEDTDKKIYGVANGAGESLLLYKVKEHLNNRIKENGGFIVVIKNGKDLIIPVTKFIKKRMWKDGHLVSDEQQYIRSEKPFIHNGVKTHICFYNNHFAINGVEEDFNNGKAILGMEFLTVE